MARGCGPGLGGRLPPPVARLIFGVLADIAEADEPVDVVTLTDED